MHAFKTVTPDLNNVGLMGLGEPDISLLLGPKDLVRLPQGITTDDRHAVFKVSRLNEREQFCIERAIRGATQTSTATMLGISKSRVAVVIEHGKRKIIDTLLSAVQVIPSSLPDNFLEQPWQEAFTDKPLSNNLSVRTQNCITRQNVQSLRDLITFKNWPKTAEFGVRGRREVNSALSMHRLFLEMTENDIAQWIDRCKAADS